MTLPTSSTGTPKKRRGPATRKKILQESLSLFARKGFDATSVRDISQAVGVSDAALYRHFPSKENIAAELFSHHFGALARVIREAGADQTNFPALIEKLTGILCELHDQSPDVFAFILLNQHEHLRFVNDDGNVVAEIAAIMNAASARGDIAIADGELAAAMALGVAVQPAVFKLYGRLPGPLSDRKAVISRAISAALGVRDT